MTTLPCALGRAVGSRVRALRLERRMTQWDLAQRAYTFRPVIGRLENGRYVPSLDTIKNIVRALGVDFEAFVEGIDWTGVDDAARATLRGED